MKTKIIISRDGIREIILMQEKKEYFVSKGIITGGQWHGVTRLYKNLSDVISFFERLIKIRWTK